jgi:hypothetical protein
MAMTIEQISLELLSLPTQYRALLAHKLITSLEDDVTFDTGTLWIREAERRFKEIQDGAVLCRPAEDVLRDARKKLARKKKKYKTLGSKYGQSACEPFGKSQGSL